MPQMSPLMWVYLMFFFIFFYLILIVSVYFKFNIVNLTSKSLQNNLFLFLI